MRYLVTGAHGFIGRRLSMTLMGRDRTAEVICVGRETDLTVRERTLDLFRGVREIDYIIHLADVSGDADWSAANALSQFLANSHMAIHVLEGWARYQPKARLIGVSSLWAYPERIALAREENYWDGRLHVPTEHYGLVKKMFGAGIGAAARQFGAHGTMLVLGSVYGPNDSSHHVIPSLIRRMRKNPALLEVQGDGSATRDFIYIDDQIEAIIQHLDYDGELLNIGSGVTHTIREVVDQLVYLMPYNGRVIFNAANSSGVTERRIDVSRAMATTGWPTNTTLHSLSAGLEKTLQALD